MDTPNGPPRVRFAPSPTGYLHVGGARTALFNWLFARQHGGTLILRMEDTDEARNTVAARQTIFDGLRWLGLSPDEGPEEGGPAGPYSQSERGEIYRTHAQQLAARGALYPCFCTRERLAELRATQEAQKAPYGYDRTCRSLPPDEVTRRVQAGESHTLRLAVPPGETVLKDAIRGEVRVEHRDIEDIILVRADGAPVYNFVVVIDDHLMGVTHVLRGEDHLTNTFKQVLLFQACGFPVPEYGHLPLILGPEGEGKLSKRKHPEAALEHYQQRGFHPEAFVNWLALIGWSYDDSTQIMSRAELIERFRVSRIQKGSARLDLARLEHLSGHYIRQMPREAFVAEIRPRLVEAGLLTEPLSAPDAARLEQIAAAWHERLVAFGDIVEACRWVFQRPQSFEPKAEQNLRKGAEVPALLRAYGAQLPNPMPPPAALEEGARAFAAAQGTGFGKLVHPLRAAWTGLSQGPPLFDCAALLGRDEALARLEAAAAFAEGGAAKA